MKKLLTLLLSAVLMISSTCFVSANDKNVLSEKVILEIKKSLTDLSIDDNTQERLITKLEEGQLWDSMNKEKVNAIPTELLSVSLEEPVKRVVFEDGSVLENRIETVDVNQDKISVNLVARNYYKNVKVSFNNGLSGGGFYADYYIDYNYNDAITKVKDSYINVIGGSYSDKKLQIVNPAEDEIYEEPAEAVLTADINYVGKIGASETLIFKLLVGNDKAVWGIVDRIGDIY